VDFGGLSRIRKIKCIGYLGNYYVAERKEVVWVIETCTFSI
jgi:hypothetical protein